MKILVTGCAGFIGSHVAEAFLKEGHDVIGIDNFHPYYDRTVKEKNMEVIKGNPKFRFVEGSILDQNVLNELKKENIEIVNHHAAIAGVRNSMKYPMEYFKINVLGTLNLLETFKDAKKFIIASSSSVYGDVPEGELPVKENRRPMPISPYALSKVQAEMWCSMFSEMYGVDVAMLRYFTVYGPRQRPDEAFTKFISKSLRGDVIEIYGDGNQTRDFTYVGDVANANVLALQKGSGVYNIGNGTRVTVNKMVKVIESALGRPVNLKHIEKQAGDAHHTHSDISKAKREMDYEPNTSLEEGVRQHLEWAKTVIK